MYLAEEAAAQASRFSGFDVFVILFTIVIAIGVYRTATAPKKNLFAIGFGVVCLLTFLVVDVVMIMNWFGIM